MKVKSILFPKLILSFALAATLLSACSPQPEPTSPATSNSAQDLFYHYSIWYAFVNRVFEGNLSARELKTKGDIGLGSFSMLDGELIMLDGIPYRATDDGKVSIADDDAKIIYANATFFDTEKTFEMANVPSYDSLRKSINTQMVSKNIFYGFKITGVFEYIQCGGLEKQEKPFNKGLDILIPERPIFEGENVKGTLVGFFCPDFIGQINVAGYHLHFISDDRKLAGHAMELKAKNLKVEMDYMYEYQFVLPETADYLNVGFETEFQYQKK